MKWYLAGKLSRKKMENYADDLTMLGDAVTSRWTDDESDPQAVAAESLENIVKADGFILFANDPRKKLVSEDKNERHVQFGLAFGLNKRVVLVGQPENTFHYLPLVEQYDTWQDFLDQITKEIEEV